MNTYYSQKLAIWRDYLTSSENPFEIAHDDKIDFSNFIDELIDVIELSHSYIEKTNNANGMLRILHNGAATPFKRMGKVSRKSS